MSTKKKIIFRFGVKHSNGECSSIWRAWTNKNDGFLATGRLANQYKASFHESGDCHVGLTKELRKTISDPAWRGQTRHFYEWEREKDIKKDKLIHLLDLWFPSSHLDLPVETEQPHYKEVIWIEAPAKKKIISVSVFIANITNPFDINLHDTRIVLLRYLSFINGHKFLLGYRHIDEPQGLNDLIPSSLSCLFHPDRDKKTYGKIESINMVNPKIRALIWEIIDGSRAWIEVSPRKVIGASKKSLL